MPFSYKRSKIFTNIVYEKIQLEDDETVRVLLRDTSGKSVNDRHLASIRGNEIQLFHLEWLPAMRDAFVMADEACGRLEFELCDKSLSPAATGLKAMRFC